MGSSLLPYSRETTCSVLLLVRGSVAIRRVTLPIVSILLISPYKLPDLNLNDKENLSSISKPSPEPIVDRGTNTEIPSSFDAFSTIESDFKSTRPFVDVHFEVVTFSPILKRRSASTSVLTAEGNVV